MKNLNKFLFSLIVLVSIAPLRSFADEDSVFLQRARKLLKLSASLADNQGVSVGLSGSGIAGAGIAVDALNFDGKLAFFCSSTVSLKVENSFGFSSDYSYIATRGCDVPSSYEGLFVSLSGYGGVDFLAKGTMGGAVSYGFNFAPLLDTLETQFIRNPKNLFSLLLEIERLNSCLMSDATSRMIKFSLQAILKNLAKLEDRISDPLFKKEISFEIAQAQHRLDQQSSRTSCGFEKISENLKKNSKQFFEYSRQSTKYKTLAALLPSKDQLGLIVDSTLDSQSFPFLKNLLFDIFRRDMSGCDSVSASLGVGLGANETLVGPSVGVGMALSHYTKIGPTLNSRELTDGVIERYVQNNGLKNFGEDSKEAYARVCTVVGKCMWKAACMMTDREAFSLGVKKAYGICSQSAKNTVAFLNSMYECFKGNFKELAVRPYEILSKVGNEP
jgi:hypothetical protein